MMIYALFYAGMGWLPLGIVIDRVLHFTISTQPLTSSFLLDLLILSFAGVTTVYFFRKDFLLGLAAVGIPIAGFISYLMSEDPAFLTLFSFSAIITLYGVRKEIRLERLMKWIALILTGFEGLVICGVLTYFATGNYSEAFPFIIRDRALWGLIEWLSIATLIVASGYWMVSLMRRFKFNPSSADIYTSSGRNNQVNRFLKSPWTLLISEALVLAAVLLPHLPSVDPSGAPVSVDTYYYLRFINYANSHGVWNALREINYARPTYLLLLYTISRIIPPVLLMDVVHPLIALSLLVFASYKLGRRLGGADVGGLAALLTPLGHTSVTFIAGGFQANSLALPLGLIMLGVNPSSLITLFSLGLAIALIHPWTFLMFSAAYLALVRVSKGSWKTSFKPLIALVTALGIAEAVGHILSSTTPTGAATSTVVNSIGLYFPRNIFRGLEAWTWGSEANALLLLAASVPATFTPVSVLMGVEFPILVMGSSVIAHRLILNTPLEIQASAVLRKLPPEIIVLMVVATIARGAEILAGMTPLTQPLWTGIITP